MVPSAATPGATITLSGTVRNEGRVPAGASALKLFLSTDAAVGAGDTLLATRAIAALATDKGEDFTVAVVLPDGPGGSLFVIAQTDANDQVPESNETNNTRAKSMGVGGDLIIFTLSGPPRAGVGSTITVDDTTRNQVSATVGATTTRFFLSIDAVFDPSDVPIGSRLVPAIGARKTHAGKTPVIIPPTTPAGAYFIIGVADADGVESEANEQNNTKSFSIVIGSDLVVSAVGVPATAGSSNTITVTDTTTNQGGAEAVASATKFYLSTDTTYGPTDVLLGSRPILPLAAGAPSNGSTDLVIPPSTQAGTYYIIARADADGVVNEADEGNNTKASVAIAFGPDLVLSSLSIPVTTGAGAIIKVSVDVTNVGGAQAGESVLKFFLSTDLVVGPGDTLLGSRIVPMLGPGARDSGATNVTIPVDTSSGVFFLIAQVDANGQVTEVNEANNILMASLKTGPDLQVEALTVPAKGAPGTVITITDSTKNLAQPAGSSVTRIYLSADDRLDANDIVLGSRTIPALAFGARSLLDSTVALPTGISGTWYIIAQADATNVLVEADEDNNTRSRAIAIGADFIVSGVTAPAGSGAGLSIAVGATIKNQGAAAGSSVTHFHLSSDDTLSGGDPFLGSLTMPAMAAGDAKVGSTTVTLPANLPAGNYYVIAKANGDGAAPETDATNNTKARLIILGPDLMVSDLTVQAGGGAGLPFTITDTTRNAGAGAAPATITSYYLSIDGILDASDVLVGSRSVPALLPLVSNVGIRHADDPPRHAGRQLPRHRRREHQRRFRDRPGEQHPIQADQDRSRPLNLDPGVACLRDCGQHDHRDGHDRQPGCGQRRAFHRAGLSVDQRALRPWRRCCGREFGRERCRGRCIISPDSDQRDDPTRDLRPVHVDRGGGRRQRGLRTVRHQQPEAAVAERLALIRRGHGGGKAPRALPSPFRAALTVSVEDGALLPKRGRELPVPGFPGGDGLDWIHARRRELTAGSAHHPLDRQD